MRVCGIYVCGVYGVCDVCGVYGVCDVCGGYGVWGVCVLLCQSESGRTPSQEYHIPWPPSYPSALSPSIRE